MPTKQENAQGDRIFYRGPRTRRYRWTCLLCLTVILLLPESVAAELRVVTTTTDLAAITREIGGEHVTVRSVTKADQDAHTVQAKPSYMRHLNRARLLIYTGLELEVGWLPLLIRGARNPRVVVGADGHLDASTAGIDILDIPTGNVDRSMGDVHPEGNPHYLLNPRHGLRVGRLIRDRLSLLDPANAAAYSAGYDAFADRLAADTGRWERQADHLRGQPIVTYHQQWEYLADWLGLDIIGRIEAKPGIPPSPRHIVSLKKRVASHNVKALISASYLDPRASEAFAEQTGLVHLVFPVAPGAEGQKQYRDLFDHIVTRLVAAHPVPAQ